MITAAAASGCTTLGRWCTVADRETLVPCSSSGVCKVGGCSASIVSVPSSGRPETPSHRCCPARQVARAGDLADWLVRKSTLHPAARDTPVMYDMRMGGYADPTTRKSAPRFEGLTLQLQRAAYRRAMRLIRRARRALACSLTRFRVCSHVCSAATQQGGHWQPF